MILRDISDLIESYIIQTNIRAILVPVDPGSCVNCAVSGTSVSHRFDPDLIAAQPRQRSDLDVSARRRETDRGIPPGRVACFEVIDEDRVNFEVGEIVDREPCEGFGRTIKLDAQNTATRLGDDLDGVEIAEFAGGIT